jgi:hypothetical protein
MRRKEILSTISSYSIGEEWSDKHAVLHDSILARTLKKITEEGLLTRIPVHKDSSRHGHLRVEAGSLGVLAAD